MGSKPWRYTGKEANMNREDIRMLVAKWWDVYNDKSLDYKPEEGVMTPEEEAFSRPSIIASMPEPTISYIPAPSAA
ncbi:Galactinol synthase 1 [Acorus gramineus]|uniref:Galactinol synthase 1 n=1 Tax=Acorus gramineus TaxID=55184 RepID=A0AAV9BZ69_ACOGR|nr:Galactinol synthase 1 [Acorus gramineus]